MFCCVFFGLERVFVSVLVCGFVSVFVDVFV